MIDSFFKKKTYDEDEKNASTSSKFEKLHENPKIEKKMKDNSSKFLELHIMNLKIL